MFMSKVALRKGMRRSGAGLATTASNAQNLPQMIAPVIASDCARSVGCIGGAIT